MYDVGGDSVSVSRAETGERGLPIAESNLLRTIGDTLRPLSASCIITSTGETCGLRDSETARMLRCRRSGDVEGVRISRRSMGERHSLSADDELVRAMGLSHSLLLFSNERLYGWNGLCRGRLCLERDLLDREVER